MKTTQATRKVLIARRDSLVQRRVALLDDDARFVLTGLGSTDLSDELDTRRWIGAPLQPALHDAVAAIVAAGDPVVLDKPDRFPDPWVRDLPAGADRDAVKRAIRGIGPAIELADLDRPPDDVEQILAGNIYQRHVILGPCDTSRAGGVLDGLTGRILRNGTEVARTSDPQANTGDLIDIVRHVAGVLAACGERLRAGQIIITGSIVPPLWVEAGEEVAFQLDPLGGVSIRFAPASNA